jgi:hypothetical protein
LRHLFLAHPLILFLTAAALAGLSGLVAYVLVFHSRAFRPIASAPLNATYITAISTIYALFLAFTAADAWQRNERARDALIRESQGLRQSMLIARTAGADATAEAVVASLLSYLRTVAEREWRQGKNRAPVAEAEAALATAERAVASTLARGPVAGGPPVAFWSEILSRFQRVREARAARLQIGAAFGDEARWGALLLLGFVCMVAVASTNVDRARAGLRALVLFGCMVAISTALVAEYEFPYIGYRAVTPEPLEALLAAPPQ